MRCARATRRSGSFRFRNAALSTREEAAVILCGTAPPAGAPLPAGHQRLSHRRAPAASSASRSASRAAVPTIRMVAAPDEFFRPGFLVAQPRGRKIVVHRMDQDLRHAAGDVDHVGIARAPSEVPLALPLGRWPLGFVCLILKDLAQAAAAADDPRAPSTHFARRRRLSLALSPATWSGLALVKGIFQFWMRVILIGISRDIEYDLRNDLFRAPDPASPRTSTRAPAPATSWRAPPTTSMPSA